MTRIIAGFAGSLTIAVPGSGTRPTSDRVREAIFSSLQASDAIDGARVLDLYAGSGALGLEAASRGAAEVVLVEKDAGAAGVCRRNAELVRGRAASGRAPRIQVVTRAVAPYVESAVGEWDLVFVDPPYDLADADLDVVLRALVPHLADDASVVLERSTRSPAPTPPVGLELIRTKTYGETAVHLLAPV
jgi:16S rRNA (guanine966-N2)-methyltransferase